MQLSRVSWLVATALSLGGCGYHSLHGGGGAGDERFAVVLRSSNVTDVAASDEVVAGVREELARAGVLTSGAGYPRCEVEVLRADESADGIAAVKDPTSGALQPTARATRVGLVARAWIVRAKDGPRERDTGDVRAADDIAVASDARTATFEQLDALRAAGRRVGHNMGARLLGLPATTE